MNLQSAERPLRAVSLAADLPTGLGCLLLLHGAGLELFHTFFISYPVFLRQHFHHNIGTGTVFTFSFPDARKCTPLPWYVYSICSQFACTASSKPDVCQPIEPVWPSFRRSGLELLCSYRKEEGGSSLDLKFGEQVVEGRSPAFTTQNGREMHE